MTDVAIGLAGAGYWGSTLARSIAEGDGCRLAAVSDPDAERRDAAIKRSPGARGLDSVEDLIADDDIEAVVLATPASMHAEHAKMALEAGKHAMVEKPLALTVREADELCALAESVDRRLMVGHIMLYAEPVRMLREMIVAGDLGRVLYVYGQRLNLGTVRQDLNAMWNFGPHDISILLYLLGAYPERVSTRQFGLLEHGMEDVVFLVLEFPGGVVGHIHESWLDPRKVRQFTVVGDEKMAVYDDTNVESPIALYDKGVTRADAESFGEFKFQVRAGDVMLPKVTGREPLRAEIEHFAECVRTGATPLSDAVHGRDVIAVLEAADQSAKENGAAVPVAAPVGTSGS